METLKSDNISDYIMVEEAEKILGFSRQGVHYLLNTKWKDLCITLGNTASGQPKMILIPRKLVEEEKAKIDKIGKFRRRS